MIPVCKNWEFAWVDLSVCLGDEREIYTRQKLDIWRFVRVTLATVDPQAVNPVLVYGLGVSLAPRKLQNVVTHMSRTDDCPVPVAHHNILPILEAIRT